MVPPLKCAGDGVGWDVEVDDDVDESPDTVAEGAEDWAVEEGKEPTKQLLSPVCNTLVISLSPPVRPRASLTTTKADNPAGMSSCGIVKVLLVAV